PAEPCIQDGGPPIRPGVAEERDPLSALHRSIAWGRPAADAVPLLDREWLVTNGLGGYASGTICGASTRRYHGLLIAAHPAPLGRVMMVNHLWQYLRLPDYHTIPFGGEEKVAGQLHIHGAEHLIDFRLEAGLPVWRIGVGDCELEKRIYFAYRHNTAYIQSRLPQSPRQVPLRLRPS